jgi:hypothetical protein
VNRESEVNMGLTSAASIGEFRLRIGRPEEGVVDSRDLAEFMMLFRGAYVAGLRLGEGKPVEAEALLAHLETLTPSQVEELFNEASDYPLVATRVTQESPIEVTYCGILTMIAVVHVLCGGTLRLPGVRSELPFGIVELISRMRKWFSKRSGSKVGYGSQGTKRVTLTKVERAILMQEWRGRGGFQTFLMELQARIGKKKTAVLVLSPRDIDIILRHGAHPEKGGFQSRIRKIFGSHFDWP